VDRKLAAVPQDEQGGPIRRATATSIRASRATRAARRSRSLMHQPMLLQREGLLLQVQALRLLDQAPQDRATAATSIHLPTPILLYLLSLSLNSWAHNSA
jgi:hypothetical protein